MQHEKQKLLDFIQSIFPMPSSEAVEIAALFNGKEFQKNDFMLREARICNEFHYLESGFARVYTFDRDGNDVTTAFCCSNQIVSEVFSFFKRIPSMENIQALSGCKTWFITYDQMQYLFHSIPPFRELSRTILMNAYALLKERSLQMIRKTAEERYAQLLQTNPDVFQYAPLKNIASYIGVTDTSFSRIRREYSQKR